ncbi:MAG: hypothetical protein KDA77_00245 [Planctomycetaceae bacterium]|nr:hypothetical protein [Planctomycetaceae bacterium]
MELNKKQGKFSDPRLNKLLVGILLLVLSYLGYEKADLVTSDAASPAVEFSLPSKAIIKGPTTGVPGSLLILDATGSTGDHFAWSVTPELPDGQTTIYPIENSTKCLLTSVPGIYTVFLAVSNSQGIDMVKWSVEVRAGPKPEPDPPKPEPEPDPPKPDPPKPDPEPDFDSEVAKQAYGKAKLAERKPGEVDGLITALKMTVTKAAALNMSVDEINAEFLANTKAVWSSSPDAKTRWSEYRSWQADTLKKNAGSAKQLIQTLQQIVDGLEALND